jgi:hypothetical protein
VTQDNIYPSESIRFVRVLLDILKQLEPDVAVEEFPDQPNSYRLSHVSGAVLVHYTYSEYTGGVRVMYFDLHVITRELNGNDGAMSVMDRVRHMVCAETPGKYDPALNSTKFAPARDTLVEKRDDGWQYALTVKCQTKTF